MIWYKNGNASGCLFTLIVAALLVLGLSARAATADDVAGVNVQAGQPSPVIIGPGDSYSISFQSQLQANQSGVENLMATGQTWVITSVDYSGDDVNWTQIWSGSQTTALIASNEVSFSISGGIGSAYLTGQTSADPTPDGFYMVSVSTTVNYEATVNGSPHQGQATSGSAATEPVAEITGVTVGSPATQTNMKQDYPNQGDINYGVVKQSGYALATATTDPSTTAVEKQIQWSNGTAVAGNNAERNYSLATSQKYAIDPTINNHGWKGHSVYMWVIWAKVTLNLAGNLSKYDQAQVVTNGTWAKSIGPNGALGPVNRFQFPQLFNAAAGRFEAVANIYPKGVWDAVKSGAWYLNRTRSDIAWDNAGHYVNGRWLAGPSFNDRSVNDTSLWFWQYDVPSDLNGGTIYDLDAPGCPSDYIEIHTSETYVNFSEYATVKLDKVLTCSANADFSYAAQVDLDNKRVDMNSLGNGSITLPGIPHYTKR